MSGVLTGLCLYMSHLNSISLPGSVSEKEERDAGKEARKKTVEGATLAQIICISVDQAGIAKGSTAA